MKSMRYFLLLMCFLGAVLPYYHVVSWLGSNSFDINHMVDEIFKSRMSMFGWTDILLTAIVLIAFILYDRIRTGVRFYVLPILGTIFIGPSFGLPFYLYLRERRMNE